MGGNDALALGATECVQPFDELVSGHCGELLDTRLGERKANGPRAVELVGTVPAKVDEITLHPHLDWRSAQLTERGDGEDKHLVDVLVHLLELGGELPPEEGLPPLFDLLGGWLPGGFTHDSSRFTLEN